MGTLNWTITTAGRNPNVSSTGDSASGAATTSTSEGAVSGLTLQPGHVISMTATEPMWVRFGGRTAAVGTGHYLPEAVTRDFEVQPGDDGAVSAIDVA